MTSADLPVRWGWLCWAFRRYSVRYARKHFHAVRLSKESATPPIDGLPLLIAMNHPSWWDPILIFVLMNQFPGYSHFGPMDADAVRKYRFFSRAGVFGVEMNSVRGAAAFLRAGQAILAQAKTAMWITGQGHFADVRVRPLKLKSGVGHLATRMAGGSVLPVAVEYTFWNESKPEALVRFGEPISVGAHPDLDGKAWTALIEARLTDTLDILNREAMSRDAAKFTSLIEGRVGVGGVYDLWRRAKAGVRRKKFDASHDGSAT